MFGSILVVDRFEPETANEAERYLPPGFTLLKADARDEAEQRRLAAQADFLVVTGVPLHAATIEAGRRLKLIQKVGVGVDKIDVAAAARCGIPVGITPGANSTSVAEGAILLMLSLFRRLLAVDASVRAGRWDRFTFAGTCSDLADRTVGIVGLGRVGRALAKRLKAFEVTTVYNDLIRPSAEVEAELGVRFVELEELLAISDVVTLHVPLTDLTRRLIDERRLAAMKSSAIVINTCRGEVVDEAALERALRSGRLAGAGLDVFENEPISGPRTLFELSTVVMTPHLSGVTRDSMARMWRQAFANCERVARGERLASDELWL